MLKFITFESQSMMHIIGIFLLARHTMWDGLATVMVGIVCPSVHASHANISESKQDRHKVSRKVE